MEITRHSASHSWLAVVASVCLVAQATYAQDSVAERVVRDFAERLGRAMSAGAIDQDHLWERGARDDVQRVLDARTATLFRWSDVSVSVERATASGNDVVADLVIRGEATWEPRAYGVASALWPLQLDERAERNVVVRRESWRLRETGGTWSAVERRGLAAVDVVSATIDAGVFSGQDAVLVECTYYVRARVDGVRVVRFLLDRRAHVYDLRVSGAVAPFVRGGELGALGLSGYTPENESSFELPKPLARGEEALVKFRILAPIVHLETDGIVTTLPVTSGPFRQRAWIPLPSTDDEASAATTIDLFVHWPLHSFRATLAPCAAGDPAPAVEGSRPEETSTRYLWTGDLREVDFLLPSGATVPAVIDVRAGAASGSSPCFVAQPASSRTRRALVRPLLDESTYSTRDLSSELQDLLPFDDEILDELFDESSGDAEEGADDRSAG